MVKELSYETFLAAYRADFSEYLYRASNSARSENRYAELTEKMQKRYIPNARV